MQDVFSQILSDLHNGKLSHAVLLDGGTDALRTETAEGVARALVCGSTSDNPCGVCSHCVKALAHSHPDIYTLAGSNTPGSIKVDDVREIRRLAGVLPNEADQKVFCILNAEAMSVSAQNALLKILEEPPAYVSFVLTCSAHDKLLDTILSRVTLYALGDEQNESESEIEQKASQTARELLLSAAKENESLVLQKTAVFEKDKELFRTSLSALARLSADALLYKAGADLPEAAEISSLFSKEKLLSVVTLCGECLQYMNGNLNANLLLTYFCAQLCV